MLSIQQVKRLKHQIIAQYAKPDDAQGLRESLATLLPLPLLWWAATLASRISPWLVAAVAAALMLFTIRVLVLMHECGHGSLFRSHRYNRGFGFVFGVIAGMPQYVWSQHHNYHHANNGNWEKFRGPLTTPSVDEYAAMSLARQRQYRWTRHIAAAPLGGFVYLILNPRLTWLIGSAGLLVHVIRSRIAQPQLTLKQAAASYRTRYWKSAKEYRHMLWNNIALLTVWAVMSQLIGTGLFFAIYLTTVSLAGGIGIALFTVQHNFEHSYASDTAEWDYDVGALRGTSFLVLPGWLNWFTANIGYHHIHHLSARIPSYRLAECHRRYQDVFSEITRVRLSGIHKAVQCLLWDRRAQRIISFAEYERQRAVLG